MIEILHYEEANKGKVTGFVDVSVEIEKPVKIILRKVAIVANEGCKWYNLPNFKRGEEPNHKYLKYFEFDRDDYNKNLMKSLADKVEEYISKNKVVNFQDAFKQVLDDNLPF